MKIAILGWGSLIWQPKELEFDRGIGWLTDGPIILIEFARISKDGRLTLVISPNGSEAQTLYTFSKHETLDEAVLNLAVREGSVRKSIGWYDKNINQFYDKNFKFQRNILDWINNKEIDAVIWTNLPENWKEKTNNRIEYLKELKGKESVLAEEYIRKAPIQIQTEFRVMIEKELNWKPIIV